MTDRFWSVPQLWPGGTVAVMASGPSMSAEVADTVRAARVPAIVVNNTFRLAPWAAVLYAADARWWRLTPDAVEFGGLKVSIENIDELPPRGVLLMRNGGREGYDEAPDSLRTGHNSGYQALHLAVKAGARRVVLCGFDMRGSGHWHPNHLAPLRSVDEAFFAMCRARFQTILAPLAQMGVEVLNCTPGSALTCFPRVALEDALATSAQPTA
jgi:hypothetical protein